MGVRFRSNQQPVWKTQMHREAEKIGHLPFPYDMVEDVSDPGRIISIISASANNELA